MNSSKQREEWATTHFDLPASTARRARIISVGTPGLHGVNKCTVRMRSCHNPILMVVARWRCWTVGGGSAGGGVVAAAVVMAVGGGGGGGGKLCQRASMCMHACVCACVLKCACMC